MPVTHGLRRAREMVRHLFAREWLAEDPVPPLRPARPSLLRLLLAPEPLAEEPERRAPRRAGLLSVLLGRERLGEEPVPPPRPPRRLLRTLFAPERLDPP